MKHKRLIIQGGLAGLLFGTVFAWAWHARPYTSTAVLRVVPSTLPDRLIPALTQTAIEVRLPSITQTVMSRANLMNVVNVYNLYPGERSRLPMEDVIESMREAIRITSPKGSSFEVSFSYPDRMLAQKVTAELTSRIVVEFGRERILTATASLQFLKDSAEKAGTVWESSVAKLHSGQAAGKPLDRVRLDTEIARQRYQSLSERVAEAEMAVELERRQQGQALEFLDPPSLPADSRPSIPVSTILGGLIGALLGWLFSLTPRFESLARAFSG